MSKYTDSVEIGEKMKRIACLLSLIILACFAFPLIVSQSQSNSVFGIVESETSPLITLPIRLNNPDGSDYSVNLTFSALERRLEFIVADFCEQNNVRSIFCRKLFETAMELKVEQQKKILNKQKIFVNQPPHSLVSLISPPSPSMLTHSTISQEDAAKIPNSHLSRNPLAIQAELLQTIDKEKHVNSMLTLEKEVLSIVYKQLDQIIASIPSASMIPLKFIILHSCLFDQQQPHVLEKLLIIIQKSGLSKEIHGIFIFHYGTEISNSFLDQYTSTLPFYFYHVSSSAMFFEIPTIRFLHAISQYLYYDKLLLSTSQILYLHTKGSSYLTIYPQIDDWINMMTYFLIERYSSCFHLLQSKEFDAIGNNYCSHPRMFSGNFWWSTIMYLSQLKELSYAIAGKYDPEQWLFQKQKIRIFIPHTSNVYHASIRYPEYCYRSVKDRNQLIPSYEMFVENCQEDNFEEYRALHLLGEKGIRSREQYEIEQKRIEHDFSNKQNLSTVRCTSFDVYTLPRK